MDWLTKPRGLGSIAASWFLVVALPARFVDEPRYTAYATGLQAFGLVLAFSFGVLSLAADGKSRRVDRVYGLHQELTTGGIDDARRRVLEAVQAGAPQPTRRLFLEAWGPGDPSVYEIVPVGSSLAKDVGRLLRFFERARLVQVSGSSDDATFAELVGRHAAWWNCCIANVDEHSRRPLMELALWADDFAERHRSRYSYLNRWGENRVEDFGSAQPWLSDPVLRPTP